VQNCTPLLVCWWSIECENVWHHHATHHCLRRCATHIWPCSRRSTVSAYSTWWPSRWEVRMPCLYWMNLHMSYSAVLPAHCARLAPIGAGWQADWETPVITCTWGLHGTLYGGICMGWNYFRINGLGVGIATKNGALPKRWLSVLNQSAPIPPGNLMCPNNRTHASYCAIGTR